MSLPLPSSKCSALVCGQAFFFLNVLHFLFSVVFLLSPFFGRFFACRYCCYCCSRFGTASLQVCIPAGSTSRGSATNTVAIIIIFIIRRFSFCRFATLPLCHFAHKDTHPSFTHWLVHRFTVCCLLLHRLLLVAHWQFTAFAIKLEFILCAVFCQTQNYETDVLALVETASNKQRRLPSANCTGWLRLYW